MGKLIVVCEGGIHTVEYLHRNGVYPHALVLAPDKIPEMLPYMSKDDEVMVLVKGLTDFTMSDVYAMLSKLYENSGKVKRVMLMSNIEVGVVPYPYYLYEGDLFHGTVKVVKDRKQYTLEGKKVGRKGDKEQQDGGNLVMQKMQEKYGDRSVNLKIYGKLKREKPVAQALDVERVVNVNLYE